MDSGPTISRPYTRHKWVGRMICSHAIESARAQDLLRLPESMTIIKNRTDNLRFSFPLLTFESTSFQVCCLGPSLFPSYSRLCSFVPSHLIEIPVLRASVSGFSRTRFADVFQPSPLPRDSSSQYIQGLLTGIHI